MLNTLLSVGGSLLGGLFGNRSKKKAAAQERAWALEDQAEQFVRMRAAAEKGGFNPLAVLGAAPNSGMVAQTSAAASTFGNSIAESALLLADGLANRKTASISLKNNSLQMANDRLQRKLTGAILRPKIGGVYSGNRPRMGIGNGSALANSASVSSGATGGRGDPRSFAPFRPLGDTEPVDPRRSVDNKPVPNTTGFMVVDNPYLPKLYVPTLDGDEPVDVLDMPSILPVVGQGAYHYGQYLSYGGGRENRPSMTRAQALEAKRQREAARAQSAFRPKPRLRFNPNHRDGYFYP